MCLMSVMTPMEFSRAEYSADHSALFRRNIGICTIAVVVYTRRVLRARETTLRGECNKPYAGMEGGHSSCTLFKS
jgi:hypothetical protein